MKLNNLIPFIVMATLVASCGKDKAGSSNNNQVADKTMLNVAYGSDPSQNMDIYLPRDRSAATTKVIVMIHGGAWSAGDKSELTPFMEAIKKSQPGYALFNINYRLSASPNNLFPTQENDVKAAIDFIYSKASEYGISGKYVLIGASAGGHLAMLQGYKYATPVKPKAIISFSGPTDLTDMYNSPAGGNALLSMLLVTVVGKTPAQDAALYASSSPVNFVTNASPPTLLLYGDVDPLLRYQQAVLVKDKLQAAGVVNQYVLYQGSAHVDAWSSAVFEDAFLKIQAFLDANVK